MERRCYRTFSTFSSTVFVLNELYAAILKGQEDRVIDLIEHSSRKTSLGIRIYDVNSRDDIKELAPLEFAIYFRKENIAEILIKKGARDRPLGAAINAGMEKIVKLILEDADVDVNKDIIYKCGLNLPIRTTALHQAVCSGKAAIVKMIRDKGADLEKINANDLTPLQCAIYKSIGMEIVRILLEAGADVNGYNSKLDTALHFAAHYPKNNRRREIMNLLLSVEGVNIEAVNISGCTPLLSAARSGNLEGIRALLTAGADVHTSDNRQQTILHHCISEGLEEEIVNLAKSRGLDFEYRDENGDTPFLYSARCEAVKAMRALAKSGANVKVYNKENKGVMHYAVQSRGHPAEMVEIALFYGANWDFLNEIEQPLDLRLLDHEMGRLARNKLLEAGLKLSIKENMELLKDYWPSCHEIVECGNFQNFQELFGKANEACLKNGVPKMIENDDDLTNLLTEYELKGAFALFKILKTIYSKKEPATELERRKFEIFDYAVMKIMEGTYLSSLSLELTSDILLCNTFYEWKLETVSFHLALAFEELNVSLDQVKKAMVDIIFNY